MIRDVSQSDLLHAVEIADRIWWVGQYLPDDHFQCHAYLLEHGDQSVLFDPGSALTFDHTVEKIEEVTPFENIRWFVCHHQDPDITASLPRVDQMVKRDDAAIVTHWRAWVLVKHYGLQIPAWLIDEHDWQLDLGGRLLRFVFTPYLHFPGAFVTFDDVTGTLFSSDLFGGFTQDWELFARDISYFDAIRPFHEHYMPSRDILHHGMLQVERLPVRMIAPQHGEVIPESLVQPLIERLKNLDCGLYLMVQSDTDIRRLSEMNRLLRLAMQRLTVSLDFRETASALLDIISAALPATLLEFYARDFDGVMLRFEPRSRYRGIDSAIPEAWAGLLGMVRPTDGSPLPVVQHDDAGPALGIPLYSPETSRAEAVAVVHLSRPIEVIEVLGAGLGELNAPLEVAVERELLLRSIESKRQEFWELAMRDPLTELYNRLSLRDSMDRLFAIHDRGDVKAIVVTLIDVDHFKTVNDTYGHDAGDAVLRRVAAVLRGAIREGDVAARYGGEEFVAVHVDSGSGAVDELAERIRRNIASLAFEGPLEGLQTTVSAGVAVRRVGEEREKVLARADAALYEAKRAGRNRVVVASE